MPLICHPQPDSATGGSKFDVALRRPALQTRTSRKAASINLPELSGRHRGCTLTYNERLSTSGDAIGKTNRQNFITPGTCHFIQPTESQTTGLTSTASELSPFCLWSSITLEFRAFQAVSWASIYFSLFPAFSLQVSCGSELQEGAFSLQDFYVRRIKRIFPALFAVLSVSSIAALFLLIPGDLAGFGESRRCGPCYFFRTSIGSTTRIMAAL